MKERSRCWSRSGDRSSQREGSKSVGEGKTVGFWWRAMVDAETRVCGGMIIILELSDVGCYRGTERGHWVGGIRWREDEGSI